MITREELLDRLASLPAELEAAEEELLQANRHLEEARNSLAERRACLLLDADAVNGRNEQQREAQLFDLTREERHGVAVAEASHAEAKMRLNRLQHEFAAARSCARLIASEGYEP
jgi:hypothetical protein